MSEFWFKPKTHGYGASPTGWKGWALILGAVLVNFVFMAALLLAPLIAGEIPGLAPFLLFLVLDAALMIGLLRVVRAKTDGEWRWRWGKG